MRYSILIVLMVITRASLGEGQVQGHDRLGNPIINGRPVRQETPARPARTEPLLPPGQPDNTLTGGTEYQRHLRCNGYAREYFAACPAGPGTLETNEELTGRVTYPKRVCFDSKIITASIQNRCSVAYDRSIIPYFDRVTWISGMLGEINQTRTRNGLNRLFFPAAGPLQGMFVR